MTPSQPLPVRCHLLIGPPASGKSTFARTLAPLVGTIDMPALVLSTDAIREELYGDRNVQGEWPSINQLLQDRLLEAVSSGVPVILDATHAYRAWRLAIIQALKPPVLVEWIGWWMTTPLELCKAWNQERKTPVPERVIDRYHCALGHQHFSPSTDEGFVCLVEVDPSSCDQEVIKKELARFPRRISSLRNRMKAYEFHGYSRLVDLERLFYLIGLLSRFPGLEANDEASREELRLLCEPLPLSQDPAERAAAFLHRQGACYADVEALRADLIWLEAQGFMSPEPSRIPIEAPPPPGDWALTLGGMPHTAHRAVFIRMMTLLRHVLQNPFDHDRESIHIENEQMPLAVHLVKQMDGIQGAYLAGPITASKPSDPKSSRWKSGESQALQRRDLPWIAAYGLWPRIAGRKGYTIGTALFTMPRLLEMHALVQQADKRLQDPSAQQLLEELNQRLRWADLSVDDTPPIRAFANRSIVGREQVPRESLAVAQQAERLEAAIYRGYRVQLIRYQDAARFDDAPPTTEPFAAWPLQLLFHNIAWYLAYEEARPGGPGLIRTERLDRLRLFAVESNERMARSPEQRRPSMKRLEQLLDECGGIYFGRDLEAQLDLCSGDPSRQKRRQETLQFRCNPKVFGFLREGVQRFPVGHTRLSKPLPNDTWTHRPNIQGVLDPVPGSSHPYPVEIVVPRWTLEDDDVDLRRWLFGFGDSVVIDGPQAYREKRIAEARSVLEAYGA